MHRDNEKVIHFNIRGQIRYTTRTPLPAHCSHTSLAVQRVPCDACNNAMYPWRQRRHMISYIQSDLPHPGGFCVSLISYPYTQRWTSHWATELFIRLDTL